MNITDELYETMNSEILNYMAEDDYESLFAYYENIIKLERDSKYGIKHKANSHRLYTKIGNYLLQTLKDK